MTKRSPAIEQEILSRLSEGEPLAIICRSSDRLPSSNTFRDWCAADENLAIAYAHAREEGEDWIAAECLTIADTPEEGQISTTDIPAQGVQSTTIKREDMLGHRKLRIETRLKLLAFWNPKKYGAKTTLSGDPDAPLTEPIDDQRLARLLAFQLTKAAAQADE